MCSEERIQSKSYNVEKLFNDLYDLSKTPIEMINIIDIEMEKLSHKNELYNWKVIIADINKPEFYYQITRLVPIKTMCVKKLMRNIKIDNILDN
jgi:hypothetical protein